MSDAPAPARRWLRPMRARDPHEPHRVSTPLELLLDLCFVVAVSQAAARLNHGLAEGRIGESIGGFCLVFYAVWWAWMNFTWFASAYDVDDVLYRAMVLVQIAGVLVLTAGVPRAFDHHDFGIITAGYCVMRVAMVVHWLRASKGDPARRTTARRYAIGVLVCQVGWVALLALPFRGWLIGGFMLLPFELLTPVWAERPAPTPWHPHHIAERYGLLTLIVLGESVLSATTALQGALDAGAASAALIELIAGALLLFFSMWWLYFDQPLPPLKRTGPLAFAWGYGHLVLFAAVAATGAGLGVAADAVTGRAQTISAAAAGSAVTLPVAIYLLAVWALQVRTAPAGRAMLPVFVLAAVATLAACFTPWPVLAAGLIAAATTIANVIVEARRTSRSDSNEHLPAK